MVYGEPFAITPDVSDEDAAKRIAEAVDAITREADAAVGVNPPTPWEPVA